MKQFAVLLFLLMLCGCDVSINKEIPKVVASDPGTQQQQLQVINATVGFLQLLDDGKADQTWAVVSPSLKAVTSEMMWSNGIKAIRLGLGSLKERKSTAIGFTQHIPDLPDGSYAVVECESTFSTGQVKEKVIFRDDDKQWRVIGYFVNKHFSFGAK